MSNLLKALSKRTEGRYEIILSYLLTEELTNTFISNTNGENVAGRIKAIQYFLDNPESFPKIRKNDGVGDRAKKVLEAIKNIKSNESIGGSKGSQFPDILEKFKSGDIQSLPNWSNSAKRPETKRNRVKQVRDNKTKLFDAIENFGGVKQTQAYEMLKNTYKIDKPAPDTYTISARPNSQKMIAYLRKVVTSSNIPKRNKREMFGEPKGTDEFLGDDYNELYPALIYIIETKDLPVDSSGNLESRGYQKKKTKLSIATKQALKGLRGSESPSGLKSIMDKIIRNTKEDIKNKKVYQDNKFLKEIAKDVDLKKQFEEYIRRLSAGVSLNKLPADDYLALASERENPTYEEYGFEGAEDFEDWVTEYDERTVAFDNMQNRSGYYVLSAVNDLKHLSRLFTEEDIDIKQTLFEIQERDSKELGQPDKRFRMFKDLIPMLEGVGLVLGVVDGNDGFGNYYDNFRDAEDKETREENYELMLKELINEGLYRKIREALRNWIYNSMKKVVDDNYRINIKGVTEPIKVLEKLKIATKKVESSEVESDE